jgi:hypothetical protein
MSRSVSGPRGVWMACLRMISSSSSSLA